MKTNPYEHKFSECFSREDYHNTPCKICGAGWNQHNGGVTHAICPEDYTLYWKFEMQNKRQTEFVKHFGTDYPAMHYLCKLCQQTYAKHYGDYQKVFCPDESHETYKYTVGEQKIREHKKYRRQLAYERQAEKERVASLCSVWHITPELNLCQHAADFYLLTAANCDYPENILIKLALRKETEFLAEQFSAYLDMILGGEVRHFLSHCNDYLTNRYETIKAASPAARKLIAYLKEDAPIHNRDEMWEEWRTIRKVHGISFLRATIELFELEWGGHVYGGHSWAIAGRVLLDYLTGEISATTFVDTAWGLQHNSDVIFDKLWKTEELQELLDYNLNGELKELYQWASKEANALLNKLPHRPE